MEEEVVVQEPPPMVEEQEGVMQDLPAPDAYADALFAHAEQCRRSVATGVDDVLSRCQMARLKLQEIVAVLVQEPGDAAEILYANLLEFVTPGMDSLLSLDPAANLVDSLFNYPGPLAGAVDVAMALVSDTFDSPRPDGGPLQAARRDLQHLLDVVHAEAGDLFSLYAATLDLGAIPGGQGAFDFWAANDNQVDAQGRLALQRLNVAVHTSLTAVVDVQLCSGPCTSRLRTEAGLRVSTALLTLQETISEVGEVLVVLYDMQDTLLLLEQAVLNITGMDPLPP